MPNAKIDIMLEKYDLSTKESRLNAMKEVLQELMLYALATTDFFEKAAFYGGTALRIFYALDRFSEDLDFSLIAPDPQFSFNKYIDPIQKVIAEFGFSVAVTEKEKYKDTAVLSFFPNVSTRNIQKNQVVKIKFEADTNPPGAAHYEMKTRYAPSVYRVRLYDPPSLFAGKIHAVLCRSWKNRIKGRDLYDYLFYIKRGTKINMKNLNARLLDSGYIDSGSELTISGLREHLKKLFQNIDYEKAREDIEPFLSASSQKELSFWDADLFCESTEQLEAAS